MKQLTVTIPDNYMQAVIDYFSRIPNASILTESEFVITPDMLATLDKSSAIDNASYLTIEESNKLLKEKFGF